MRLSVLSAVHGMPAIWDVRFWEVSLYIHQEKTQMLKKTSFDKINGKEDALFFFRELQLVTV